MISPRSMAGGLVAALLLSTQVSAQEGGPCTDDIAKLKRELSQQVGLGAPVSQPEAGLDNKPSDKGDMTAGNVKPGVGSAEAPRAQDGGASLTKGGSAGTVGGVAGAVDSSVGGEKADAVASGRVATSPADVRRQSENRPTAAAAAASGADTTGKLTEEDKNSQAKVALQRAVDLNAAGDKSCSQAVADARKLASEADKR